MRRRLVVLLAAVLLGVTGQVSVSAAAEDDCLSVPPTISQDTDPVETIVLKNTRQVPIEMRAFHDAVDCSGMTVDVQKADGTGRTTVALTHQGGRGMPPSWTWYGYLSLTAATGGGDWVITRVTHGANILETDVRFHVYRGSELTLDQPARTSGAARTTLSGQLRRYSNTGALVPAANTTVTIRHWTRNLLIATAKTDAAGRYKVTVPFTQNTTLRATTEAGGNYVAELTEWVTAHKLIAMSYLQPLPNAYANAWWKVGGTAYPGRLQADLQLWNGKAWATTGSYGFIGANGAYERYWRPTRAGVYRLRVVVSGERLDNTPWSREVTVTVKQLPTQPSWLTGTVAPTAGPPVKFGTTMSSFGFLKARQPNGTYTGLPNEVVRVIAKRPADAGWAVVGQARTTSSGYFFTHWSVPFAAGETFTAVLDYPTALPRVASSRSGTFGPFTVQP
ncbi:hypothetical protein FB561_2021 [Kribbella amoyensis]|uniref:Carboxypeptidase regulatory-like domain-containing protein n=1 Tax=Kribbella amoyensis TaxID=996641 RepID=A0A561BQ40_9ACTN|nr:hypothetical protein [Kribbella amoyensis]TWD80924.1 hypothetical protein FB561_2021 [Kribbella amoyensis]